MLEYAANHRESCRRQVEILKKELAKVTEELAEVGGEF